MDLRNKIANISLFSTLFCTLISPVALAEQTDTYIIQFSERYSGKTEVAKEVLSDSIQSFAKASGVSPSLKFKKTYNHVIPGAAVQISEGEAKHLKSLDIVKHIEKDSVQVPNQGWGLDRVNQRDLPLDDDFSRSHFGSGATIFVVDTGVDQSHDEFEGPFLGLPRVELWAASGLNGLEDCEGHGTHVASIAAGNTVGVANEASIYSIRISDDCVDGDASTSDVLDGLDYVASRISNDTQMYPIIDNAVVNYSYSSTSGLIMAALDNLVRHGAVVVTAAGNDDVTAECHQTKPRSALFVGATTDEDERWVNSNFGACVNVMAPGENITGAEEGDDDGLTLKTGTSMASPYVAGIAAAYLEKYPNSDRYEVMEAIIDGASQGKLSDLQGSPNRLAYIDLDRPDAYWQTDGYMQSPANVPMLPDPGCDTNDVSFTTLSNGLAVRWVCQ